MNMKVIGKIYNATMLGLISIVLILAFPRACYSSNAQNGPSDYSLESDAMTPKELFDLGNQFLNMGIYDKARMYWEKAAEQGHRDAIANLGSLYLNGFGVKKDFYIARQYLDKAAAMGSADAIGRLKAFRDDPGNDEAAAVCGGQGQKCHDLCAFLRQRCGYEEV